MCRIIMAIILLRREVERLLVGKRGVYMEPKGFFLVVLVVLGNYIHIKVSFFHLVFTLMVNKYTYVY